MAEILIAPAPGSTAVPVDVGMLSVSAPADGTFTLVARCTTIATARATALPSPRPSVVAFASFAVPVPTLSPATTYLVHYDAAPDPGSVCGSGELSDDIGSFTTR